MLSLNPKQKLFYLKGFTCSLGSPGGSVLKNSPASAGDTRHSGPLPSSGHSLEGGNGNPSILVWKIPWTEEPSRLQSMGL